MFPGYATWRDPASNNPSHLHGRKRMKSVMAFTWRRNTLHATSSICKVKGYEYRNLECVHLRTIHTCTAQAVTQMHVIQGEGYLLLSVQKHIKSTARSRLFHPHPLRGLPMPRHRLSLEMLVITVFTELSIKI